MGLIQSHAGYRYIFLFKNVLQLKFLMWLVLMDPIASNRFQPTQYIHTSMAHSAITYSIICNANEIPTITFSSQQIDFSLAPSIRENLKGHQRYVQ